MIKRIGKKPARKITVVVLLILVVFLYKKVPLSLKEEQDIYLLRMYYVSQIVSSVFVIAGVMIAVWQYYLNSRIEIIKNNKENITKAIDLSEYYKDNILSNFSVIKYVYANAGIDDILKKIDYEKIECFDEKELKWLLSDEDISQLKKIETTKEFAKVIIDANEIFGLNLRIPIIHDADGSPTENINNELLFKQFINGVVQKMLNNMEFFAMYFTHNTAKENVVYQSLHKTYVAIVKELYYNIAIRNIQGETYLYTNVTKLYKMWNAKYTEDKEKIEKNDKRRVEPRHGEDVENLY